MTQQLLKPMKPSKPKRHTPPISSGIVIEGHTRVPARVVDHASFRVWACSNEFPRRGRFAFLNGEIWADLSMETGIHNRIKAVISKVLIAIMLDELLGEFFMDGMLLTNASVGLSTEPDGCFVATRTFDDGLILMKNGEDSLELEGTPDMTLEVISKTSIRKDTVTLKELYAAAGVAEYWLVDSTIETPTLEIHRLQNGKYVAARNHDGWVKSNLFSRSFRLTSRPGIGGRTQFILETK